jgi:hypothetical protein
VDAVQLWAEGYKARGEACKQGGLVSSALILILGGVGQIYDVSYAWPTLFLGGGVLFSALAYWLAGLALTNLAKNKSAPINIEDLDESKGAFKFAAVCGMLEILALIVGVSLTVWSIATARQKPTPQATIEAIKEIRQELSALAAKVETKSSTDDARPK